MQTTVKIGCITQCLNHQGALRMSSDNLYFTEDHEWVKIEGNTATIGITKHAAEELGEVVFCELPEVGINISQADECGSVESVKTVSSIFTPLSGEVIEINSEIQDNAAIINESPYEEGWLFKLDIADMREVDDLMTESEYETYLDANQDDSSEDDNEE